MSCPLVSSASFARLILLSIGYWRQYCSRHPRGSHEHVRDDGCSQWLCCWQGTADALGFWGDGGFYGCAGRAGKISYAQLHNAYKVLCVQVSVIVFDAEFG